MPFHLTPPDPSDDASIDHLLRAAFDGPLEAELVAKLRLEGDLAIALVARSAGAVVGYVAASPASPGRGLGLAPVAVDASHRRLGVARALIDACIDRARGAGYRYMIVLGDPAYYARFGFRPASHHGLRCVFGGGDAFQVLALAPGGLPDPGTLVEYAPAFGLFDAGPSA